MSAAALLRLLRWPGALTAAANAVTGFLLVRVSGGAGTLAAGVAAGAAGALVYLGGVVLNDWADAERDRELHPARPLPSGAVGRSAAGRLAALLLAAGCGLAFAVAGPACGAAVTAAAFAAVAYDLVAKRARLPGSIALALARGANAAAGMLASAGTHDDVLARASDAVVAYPVCVAGYTLLLTYTSTFEGRRISPAAATALVTALALPAGLAWPHFPAAWWWAPALALLPLLATLVAAAREAQVPDGPGIGALVRAGVFGFLLVDAAWLLGVGWYDAGFWLILAYVALRFLLARLRS